jgi:hypothetical protein
MLRALTFLFLTVTAALGQTFLAYQGADSGCIFLGNYNQGRFTDTTKTQGALDPYTDAARARVPEFTGGREYPAITARGDTVRILVTDVSPKQDQPTYRFRATTSEPVLISTAPLPIEIVRAVPASLSQPVVQQIRLRAKQLWDRAVGERGPDHELGPEQKLPGYSLGQPQATTVQGGSGMLAVYYPLDIEPSHDTRGSMFFLYSEKQHEIIRAEFGHPQWGLQSSARTIHPEFYFRIKGTPDIHFLAEYSGGWEDRGYAILNMRTGKTELYCY